MSKTFETAGLRLVEYFVNQGDVAKNKLRPVWFSEAMGKSYEEMLKQFDPTDADNESANMYKAMKQPGAAPVNSADSVRLRRQVLFMASVTQAARRRYVACEPGRQRTACDTFRYEKERKVVAGGRYFHMVQELKDRQEQTT